MFSLTQFDLQQHNAVSTDLNLVEWSIYPLSPQLFPSPRGKASAKCHKVQENRDDNRFWSLQKHEKVLLWKVRFFKLQLGRIKAVKERLHISKKKKMLDQKNISCSCFALRSIEATVWERNGSLEGGFLPTWLRWV